MFEKPSLITRIGVGKAAGLMFGLAGFFAVSNFAPDSGELMRWGLLLWYTTLGGLIGIFGVFTWHPVLKLPMPWWFRAPFLGAWMNFVLVFFAHDKLAQVLAGALGPDPMITSPFWFTLQGALVGLIIGFLTTHFGGEGKETVATV